jgi:hypothetical protein
MREITPEELEKKLESLRPPTSAALDGCIEQMLSDAAGAQPRARIGRLAPYGLIAAGIVGGIALAFLVRIGLSRALLSPVVPIRVSAIRGTILVKHAGTAAWEEMSAATRLRLGDQLWSGTEAGISLELRDNSLVALNSGSRLSVTEDNGRVEFELTHGTMRAVLRDGHPPFFVRTPQGLLKSLGTEFTVSVE